MDGQPFDVNRLPLAYGPKTTETLIEKIFNPLPTSSPLPSPFTYYVSPDEKEGGPGNERVGANGNDVEAVSVYSVASSSEDTTKTTSSVSESGHGGGQKLKPWWKKITSRPETPGG